MKVFCLRSPYVNRDKKESKLLLKLSFFLVCSLSTILHFSIFADLYFSEMLNNLPKAKILNTNTHVNKIKLHREIKVCEHVFLQLVNEDVEAFAFHKPNKCQGFSSEGKVLLHSCRSISLSFWNKILYRDIRWLFGSMYIPPLLSVMIKCLLKTSLSVLECALKCV